MQFYMKYENATKFKKLLIIMLISMLYLLYITFTNVWFQT